MDALERIVSDADVDGFVNFGDVARNLLNMQCQYASYYVGGVASRPDLGEGLRIIGDAHNYHSLRIHKDDVVEFVQRVEKERSL